MQIALIPEDIRAVTEQFMAQHPEQFDGQHVYVAVYGGDKSLLFPERIHFRNYNVNHGAKAESGGLCYGDFQIRYADLTMLSVADGFTDLALRGFLTPEDFSALDGMDALRVLELHTNSMGEPMYKISQEALDAFAKQHPDCKLTGVKAREEKEEQSHETERKSTSDL